MPMQPVRPRPATLLSRGGAPTCSTTATWWTATGGTCSGSLSISAPPRWSSTSSIWRPGRVCTAPPSRTRKPSAAATSCTASPTTAMTRPASCRRPPRPPSAAPLWTAAPGSGWAARRFTRSWSRPTPPCATSCSSSTCRELGRNPTSPPSSTPSSRASAPTRRLRRWPGAWVSAPTARRGSMGSR